MAINRVTNTDINNAALELSRQKANVVLCFNRLFKQPIFRRGSIPLSISPSIANKLLERTGNQERLFNFSHPSLTQFEIEENLRKLLESPNLTVEEAFCESNVSIFENFPKVLLIPPYGTTELAKIRSITPHLGVERISSYLLRHSINTDSRVYNPNLGGLDNLWDLLKEEHFSVIGFSHLFTIFENIVFLMAQTKKYSPDSLIVFGGPRVERLPFEVRLEALPTDIVIYGKGEIPLTQIMDILSKNPDSGKNLYQSFGHIANISLYENGNLFTTPAKSTAAPSSFFIEDVAHDEPDCTHGKSYKEVFKESGIALGYDQIGFWPLRIKLSDFCRGKCFFCHVVKNTQKPQNPDDIIEKIKIHEGSFDHLHFEDHDLLFDWVKTESLCNLIVKNNLQKIPKRGSTRVDRVTPQILTALSEAGFKILTYGVESFDQGILDFVGKGTNVEQNHFAIDQTLRAFIKPGIFLMIFTPLETERTLEATYNGVLPYLERGAYLGGVTHSIKVEYGDKLLENYPHLVVYKDIFYDGMRGKIKIPRFLRVLDPRISAIKEEYLKAREEYALDFRRKNNLQSDSLALYSLLGFRLLFKLLGKTDDDLDILDEIIFQTVAKEKE